MELKALRCFVAVAEELHFGRAAKRLHISQPPVSRQIQKLEHELGSELLRRTQRRVELTAAGRVFLEHSIGVLRAVDAASAAVHSAERGEIGRLEIGYFRGAIYTLLPTILKRFRQQRPKVEVVLREMEMSEVHQALIEQIIDVGLLRPPIADPAINTELLSREPIVAVIPTSHRLARKPRIRLADLASEPFVTFGPSPSILGDQIMNACYQAGFNPRVIQQARHPEALIGLVRSGAGIALVAASAALQGGSGVKFTALDRRLPMAEIVVAWRRNNADRLVHGFLESARAVAARRL